MKYEPVGAYSLLRPILFSLDSEKIHEYTLNLLGILGSSNTLKLIIKKIYEPKRAELKMFGLTFKNRVGLSAGFDKNAKYLDGLEALGFGHVEVGTITPKPQVGNAKPRMLRSCNDFSIINNMGFPNEGLGVTSKRIQKYCEKKRDMIVGVNIGKNKDTPNKYAYKDYFKCFMELKDFSDYIVINVSSPNTNGLRLLQEKDELLTIISPILNEKEKLGLKIPILVKMSPDKNIFELMQIIDLLSLWGIDGVVLFNTTNKNLERGGMSGLPLRDNNLARIKEIRKYFMNFPIIASGGIGLDGDLNLFTKSGADLVQIWTSMIYRGPGVLKKL